jgi:GDP-4-dehydro-6-deoxy-D-mannose reductase
VGADMMLGSVLVTGGTGFVGAHLLKALRKAFPGVVIHATGRRSVPGSEARVVWHEVDLRDRGAVYELVHKVAPTIVVHLAAQSNVPVSFKHPDLTWRINLDGALNLFGAVELLPDPVLLLQVGSADMYGASFREGGCVDESVLLQPLNPYAASKSAADLAAYQLSQTSSVRVLRVRPFNHIGQGQSDAFVVSSFARQIVEVEMGLRDALSVGDLSAERDFLHVSDVVDAYVALIKQNEGFETGAAVNICSGVPVTIATILEQLISLASIEVRVIQDQDRMRKSDIAKAFGSHRLLTSVTGWAPTVDLQSALQDVLDDWRKRLA